MIQWENGAVSKHKGGGEEAEQENQQERESERMQQRNRVVEMGLWAQVRSRYTRWGGGDQKGGSVNTEMEAGV